MSEHVRAAIGARFADSERAAAASALARYGTETHEREAERVRLAIVRLSGGDLGTLEQLVARANEDYRDVLWWSEQAR